MTKYVATLFAAIAIAVTAQAAAAPTGPITLPAKNGNVTFEHAKHASVACNKCHATAEGGKIEGFGKDVAHKTCIECHKAQAK
ncbi:MAG TPA: cytochrome c3 family protein, partial [Anaeromyxobacteraceae bacterium]|nr:cytochrome c3 family protein [Anaeromyxobacteraceae bacterium]